MNGKSDTGQSASWTLRLTAIAITLLVVAGVFAIRFGYNNNEIQAIMWAATPVAAGLLLSLLLGYIKKLSSSKKRWEIYVGVLVIATVGVLWKHFM